MKKPKPNQRRSSARRKTAQTPRRSVPPAARRRKLAVAGIVAAAVMLVAGATAYEAWRGYAASDRRHSDASRAFAYEISDQAKVQISEESRDLGTMAVSEERSAEFSVRNVGGKPLEISQVRTSCMCTFAHVTIGGEESPDFNMEMHNAPSVQEWTGVIEPGLTATVRLTYKPSLMPVQGPVARYVKLNTNDPARPVIELSVHANVQ